MEEKQMRMAEELLFSDKPRPSFAKALYFGHFDSKRIFPYPQLSAAEKNTSQIFISKLQKFLNEKVDPDWIDRNATIPENVIQGLGELGVLGMTAPKEYGGMGSSQYAYCKVMETLAGRCASTALFVNAHHSIGMRALLLFGTEQQKKRWLPIMGTGKAVGAFSLTEPNAGSDAAGVQTTAEFDAARRVYKLNGRKQWTTNGSIASVLTVMAQTKVDTPKGPEEKITAFLVTPDMPGFKVMDKKLEKVGMRGSTTSNLSFENLEVPEENILGPKGKGLKVCLTVLDYGRTTFGATCTGAAKVLLKRAIDHAKNRQQFNRPLASFSLVKKKIALMSALTYAMDATTFMTAGLVDRDQEDIMLESAMLKVFASDSLWQILYDTMQILGGRSFFTDQPYERMMRDARLNMIGEGSNEVMRAFIGAVGMRDVGMELKAAVDSLKNPFKNINKLWSLGSHWFGLNGNTEVPVKSPLLADEAKDLGKMVKRFGKAVTRLLAKHKEQIIEQQLSLDRIATIAMAIYTTASVLSKLDSELESAGGKKESLGNDLEIGKSYCHYAFKQMKEAFKGLTNNNDQEIEALSAQISGVN